MDKPMQQLAAEVPCPPSQHSCLITWTQSTLPCTSSETHQTLCWPDATLTQQEVPFFFFFHFCLVAKTHWPAGRCGTCQGQLGWVDLLVAADWVPSPGHLVQAVSRLPGSAGSVTWTGSVSSSERDREEQSGGTALSWWRQPATSCF